MRKVVVPEGQTLYIPVGRYKWVGPCEVMEYELAGKKYSHKFLSGDRWEWVDANPEPTPVKSKTIKEPTKKPANKTVKKGKTNAANEQAKVNERPTQESKNSKETPKSGDGDKS